MKKIKVPSEYKSAWISRGKEETEKPWGFEISWSGFSGIHGKTLFIKKGCRTSLKYHRRKSEVLMVRSGSAKIDFGSELAIIHSGSFPMKSDILSPGDSLQVQSGCPYRITALEDCEIFEIGDCRGDLPIRLEDDYGRVENE